MTANDYEYFLQKKVLFCWLVQKIVVILQKISLDVKQKTNFTTKNERQDKP